MAHITLSNDLPGIIGPMTQYPQTAQALNQLAQVLLQTDEELTKAERELIAAHVSQLNTCTFCSNSHLNAALAHLEQAPRFIDVTRESARDGLSIRPVVEALLEVAGKVQQGGLQVSEADIRAAKQLGATDRMIHDTVLIAAAFCMFNRYVDGLATWRPEEVGFYAHTGKMLADEGYLNSIKEAAPQESALA